MEYTVAVANRKGRLPPVRGRPGPGGRGKGKGKPRLATDKGGLRKTRRGGVRKAGRRAVEGTPEGPIAYEAFRTGLTFADVYALLWSGSSDPADWKYKRRGTILGKWHQIKTEQYANYIDRWEDAQQALIVGHGDQQCRTEPKGIDDEEPS